MTLAVLAIDAADRVLVDEFGCRNLLLNQDTRLTTRGYQADQPHTDEIWPMVATGQHPNEHQCYTGDGPEWSWPVEAVSRVLEPLPEHWRTALGRVAARVDGEPDTLDQEMFDRVRAWPGVCDDGILDEYKAVAREISDYSGDEAVGRLAGLAGRDLTWAATQPGIVGCHTHALDIGGHLFADDRTTLAALYRLVDNLVGAVREVANEVVVISDHGMQVTWLDDPAPANHSYRAFTAATAGVSGPLPKDIGDVHAWLESQSAGPGRQVRQPDQPTETLQKLGYIQ